MKKTKDYSKNHISKSNSIFDYDKYDNNLQTNNDEKEDEDDFSFIGRNDAKIKKTNSNLKKGKVKNKKNKNNKKNDYNKELNLNNEEINLKKVKELKKRKRKEQKARNKKLKKIEKNEAKKQKRKIKRKLNNKEIEKIRRTKRIIKAISIFILIVLAIILFLMSPIFYIDDIIVENNEKLSDDAIVNLLNINNETNIFEENDSKINNALKQNPYIEEVQIKRILPSTLKLTIKERKVMFLLEYANSFVYVDKNGNILEISSNDISENVKILGYSTENIREQKKLTDDDIKKLNEVREFLKAFESYNIKDKITSIDIRNDSDYLIYMQNDGKVIHFGDYSNSSTKVMYIKAVLEKEEGNQGEIYVNMDLNKKNPYFKQNV